MRFLLWIIILATLAVGVAFIAQLNTGYVVFVFPPYRIDLSVTLFIIYLLLAVGGLYLLLKLVVATLSLPGVVRRWRERRKQNEARKQGYLAIIALTEGRLQQAIEAGEKALLNERNPEARVVVALTIAKAAHACGDMSQRDKYLQQIELKNNKLNITAALLKAEMLVDNHHDEAALAVLETVRKKAPKLISAMRLELRIQQRLGHTGQVIELTDKLERLAVFEHMMAERIRHEAYLQQVTTFTTGKELINWWTKLPLLAKENPQIALKVAKYLVTFEETTDAVHIIENTLDKTWDASLVEYYGRLKVQDVQLTKQLQKAEGWLKKYQHDAQLLFTLGRLCVASQLWGKAQSYFEASIAVYPTAVTHTELAHLFDDLEQTDKANQHYRHSIELALK